MNVAEYAYSKGILEATLGFSTGKDSVVGLDMLLKAGLKVIPIYFYVVPGLKFIEDNIKMYEDHFEQRIVRLPHPMLYDYIDHLDWQPYDRAKTIAKNANGHTSFRELTNAYLKCMDISGFEYDCNCMKMADSLNRRLLLRKIPDVDEAKKIIYLTKYLTDKGCFDYIKAHNIPLTKDYEIWGRSWDGLKYDYTMGVKKFYPEDYETIKSYFPLIDAEIIRYKLVKKYLYEQII
ncbi:MAG: hypothetical protein FWF52_04335 [Candidatus Azobacteroides sp.]|nr:hypothetical protein [Candidatus Azobacteroides sp.]